jgi:hypothetical protein
MCIWLPDAAVQVVALAAFTMSALDDLPLKLPDSEEIRKKIMLLEVRNHAADASCASLAVTCG